MTIDEKFTNLMYDLSQIRDEDFKTLKNENEELRDRVNMLEPYIKTLEERNEVLENLILENSKREDESILRRMK